jgi:hypothetical protein
MEKITKIAVPAKPRKWVYHLTPSENFSSIQENGLIPYIKSGKFGYLSIEAYDGRKKIFLLPNLHGKGMKSFLKEWWHGDIQDIIILRVPFESIENPLSSPDPYYANQEIWTHYKIDRRTIQFTFFNERKWKNL